jgi:YggT family protein
MFVLGNFLEAVAKVLDVVLQGLLLVILIDAVLSWVGPGPRNPFVQVLDRISDFVCEPLRRLFPTVFGGIDFAPFIAMLAIYFVQLFVVGSLHGLAVRLG